MSSADKTKLDGIATSANNYTHPNHSGEVTSSGDGATTIANDVVTNAKLANMATATIKGRATAGTGDPEDLSASSVRTLLNTDQVTDARTPTAHAHGALTNDGKVGTTSGLPLKTGSGGIVEAGSFGTSAGSFCAGDDARLSDDRDPNLHAASHLPDGADEIFDQSLNTDDDVTFESLDVSNPNGGATITLIDGANNATGQILVYDDGGDTAFEFAVGGNALFAVSEFVSTLSVPLDFAGGDAATNKATTRTNLGLGDAAVEDATAFAASGSITTSGLTQATARILGRTTASTGAVEEIQIGSGLSLSAGELSSTVSAGIPATLLDAKGDLILGSAADTAARLAVGGTNGHVLTVDSAETLGVKWAAAPAPDLASPTAIGSTAPNTGAFTSLTGAPAANTAAYAVTGYSLTGSNAQSVIDLAGTWNTTGTPSAIKLNITDTASNASSLLMQLQTGGTNRFTVNKDGLVTASDRIRVGNGTGLLPAYSFVNGTNTGIQFDSGVPRVLGNLNGIGIFVITSSLIAMQSSQAFGWTSGGSGVTADALLRRDAAGTIAQYNGTNAQEKRLYGTYTSSTNYQRMTIKSVKQTLSALSGASATTTGTFIPDGAVVVGVTTRVATLLTGATGYTIGDGTDADRWGDITGTAIGTTSDNANWTAGTIECFTAGGEVTLTANGSNFTAGAIEICVFYLAGQAD
jgi:hypothetical protein